jgi:nudix-type nucleoside diphosphatase (YffH/AdpP family)
MAGNRVLEKSYLRVMDKHIELRTDELLSAGKYNLRKISFDYTDRSGRRETQTRYVFDRGNGAAILLYNRETGNVILTRQFRLPTWLNGNPTGMLIEVCAGELDEDAPEAAIRRETEEEVGIRVGEVNRLFDAYLSPGAATEIVTFFTAEYTSAMKVSEGGGLASEHEEIEVLEMPYEEAMRMVRSGKIGDARTILLLLWVRGEIFPYI